MHKFIFLFILMFIPLTAKAELPAEISTVIDSKEPIGTATGKVLLWTIYDAELWSLKGQPFSWENPLALVLNYRMNFTAQELVDSSIKEIKRIEGDDSKNLPELAEKLSVCFSDVTDQDQFIGFSDTDDTGVFYLNGSKTCEIEYSDFKKRFFAIWLDDNSRDKDGARRLRGLK